MKIVIVGGGTAGWLAAMYCIRFNESARNEIVVIESSKIPTIGAGEGSTGKLADVINNYFTRFGITEIDFLNNTEAILKLGICFKDWNGDGSYFYNPINPSNTYELSPDSDLLINHFKGNYYDSSPGAFLLENGYSTYNVNKKSITAQHGYHFDANKVGQYLKSIAIKNRVSCLDTEITSLNRNSLTGDLDSVETTIGKIEADFWIDCSGFAKVLIEPMGGGWKSYSEHLPVNGAIPYIHQFERDEDIKLETLSWAMPNGWMWQIPTQKSYGCGYVYSDMFTTYDKAVDELIKTTGRKIEPLRNLKFEVGRLDKGWVNNVIGIGLSSAFLEPLEATSIHSTIIQLDLLFETGLNFINKESVIYQSNINSYNRFVANLFDDVKDLIQLHYTSQREDTEFWKYCKYEMKRTDKVNEIIDIAKHRSPSMLDFNQYHGYMGWGVWAWTIIGLGHLSKDISKKTIESYGNSSQAIENRFREIKHSNLINSIKSMKREDFIKALINKKLQK
jgi:tryptophan halogenase